MTLAVKDDRTLKLCIVINTRNILFFLFFQDKYFKLKARELLIAGSNDFMKEVKT